MSDFKEHVYIGTVLVLLATTWGMYHKGYEEGRSAATVEQIQELKQSWDEGFRAGETRGMIDCAATQMDLEVPESPPN